MQSLLKGIKNCTICSDFLPFGANPVLTASKNSKIVIIGQAPGRVVHSTSIPWDDRSGDNLRNWLGVDKDTFYNTTNFGLIPMGFCYPGTGKSGDLPPRKECAPQWHHQLFEKMPNIELILLIGKYAQDYYLKSLAKKNLTETVANFEEYLPKFLPLPHPSPRNIRWMRTNDWFESGVLPLLKNKVEEILK